jgi:hypothetical protein
MNTTTAIVVPTTRPSGDTPTRAGRWAAIAAAVYVAAWLVGLVIAPKAPANTDSAVKVHDYYLAHGSASLVQSLLIHGLAGIALIVLATTTYRVFGKTTARVAGIAAAVVSFVQVGLAVAATHHVAGTAADTSRNLFHAINLADTVKLVFLAGFVGLLTKAVIDAGAAGRRYPVLGLVTAPVLAIGGLSFIVDNSILYGLLELSLLLLLAWAGITGAKTRSHTKA